MSPAESTSLRLGLIAPKNTQKEMHWLLNMLTRIEGEPYRPGRLYDAVWFLNITPEIIGIRNHTDMKVMVVGMEPEFRYPLNYDASLLRQADVYSGYRNFAGEEFTGRFLPFSFPVKPEAEMRREFPISMKAQREYDFCLFATHDPNIRTDLVEAAGMYRTLAAGPLFGRRVDEKLPLQRQCRFEFITENDLNDYYFSEKLGESLLAGCVPVYLGCERIREFYPADCFIDMRDFYRNGQVQINALLEYCMTPGRYERYTAAIQEHALHILVDRFSIERCLIQPLQTWLDELSGSGFRARRVDAYWQLRKVWYELKTGGGR